MLKIVSFGEVLVDMLSDKLSGCDDESDEKFTKFPGGAPANVAAAVAKLGGNSYFSGKLSSDTFGKFLLQSLQDMGVKTDYVKHTDLKKTALAFVSLDDNGERSFEFYREDSADLNFRISDFDPNCFESSGVFHICSNTLTTPEIAAVTLAGQTMAQEASCLVSFDVNLRLNLWNNQADTRKRIWDSIALSNLVKLSKEELEYLANGSNENSIINKMLSLGVFLVVVTDAAQRLTYHMKDGSIINNPPTVTMIDSTAAGDAFVGGLLYSFAREGINLEKLKQLTSKDPFLAEAIHFASACGAYAVTSKGAFTSLPELTDITNFLQERT